MRGRRKITDKDYERLLEFRAGLRRFLKWSERQAAQAGLSPMQHQLLLAIRGHGEGNGPTIGDVARHLLVKHHSAVELVDRAEAAGLVQRVSNPEDKGRTVRLRCTDEGLRRLQALTAATLEELARAEPHLTSLWDGLEPHDAE